MCRIAPGAARITACLIQERQQHSAGILDSPTESNACPLHHRSVASSWIVNRESGRLLINTARLRSMRFPGICVVRSSRDFFMLSTQSF